MDFITGLLVGIALGEHILNLIRYILVTGISLIKELVEEENRY